jgi:hypothetical protein
VVQPRLLLGRQLGAWNSQLVMSGVGWGGGKDVTTESLLALGAALVLVIQRHVGTLTLATCSLLCVARARRRRSRGRRKLDRNSQQHDFQASSHECRPAICGLCVAGSVPFTILVTG